MHQTIKDQSHHQCPAEYCSSTLLSHPRCLGVLYLPSYRPPGVYMAMTKLGKSSVHYRYTTPYAVYGYT